MNKRRRDDQDRQAEGAMKVLGGAFARAGITVRREKLSCGSAYRAKSGRCLVGTEQVLFVDRRLAPDQQLAVVVDYLLQLGVNITPDEQTALPGTVRDLITARGGVAGGEAGIDSAHL